jgi:uncharacterized membrane protein YedE/YeeE
MNRLNKGFRNELWSPYAAGVLLGVVGVLAVWLADSLLGASGAFESVAGMIGKALAPQVFNIMYFNFIMPSGITWAVVLLLGVMVGGALGALSSRTWKLRLNTDDKQWKAIIGPQMWKRWLIAFFGAIILEYGAGIAGGCTSGLAISGGLQLTPSAFLFMAGMFASGIPTAMILYRKRY